MRRLSEGEERLARSVFGDEIGYGRVRVLRRPFGQAAVVFGPLITLPPGAPQDFAAAPLPAQAWFIHEMAHVWQFQHAPMRTTWSWLRTLLGGGYGRGRPGYRYTAPLGDWRGYNLEQQASMIEHAFLLRSAGVCKAAPVGLSEIEACIPFSPRERRRLT